MSAQGDLRNQLRKESRHKHAALNVELLPSGGKFSQWHDDPSLPLQIREEAGRAEVAILPAVREGLAPGESQALDLLLGGERKTAVFAKVLGIDHLSKKEQEAEVKKVKDKLKKRIERGDHDPAS